MAKACFCLSLPTAGYVIGILDLVLTVIKFYMTLKRYPDWDGMSAEQKTLIIVIIVIVCAISFAVNGLLIYGINKKRAGFVLAFLFGLVIEFYNFLTGAAEQFWLGDVLLFFGTLICCFVVLYIIYVIFMLYNEIKESSQARPYHAAV